MLEIGDLNISTDDAEQDARDLLEKIQDEENQYDIALILGQLDPFEKTADGQARWSAPQASIIESARDQLKSWEDGDEGDDE